MTSPSSRRIAFTGKQQVLLERFSAGSCETDEVLIHTHLSLMSTGTENIVFNRHFDEGSHWDRWVKYPFYPGYTSVGTIVEVGSSVTSRKIGDRVAFRVAHRSHAMAKDVDCYPIPDGLSFENAVWFSLAKIAFMGAKAADYHLGDTVLIIGAGPIGQMSIRWANATGAARIVVVDTAVNRMPLAKAGGATSIVTSPIKEAREMVLEAGNGKLPRVVIDSTGNAAVFSAALGMAADRGKIVILGDTGQPTQQTLTSDVIGRGLTIIGAHDAHNTAEWNDATIMQLFFDLTLRSRFSLDGLNTHTFEPEACGEAYAVANRDRSSTMGIVFDWTK